MIKLDQFLCETAAFFIHERQGGKRKLWRGQYFSFDAMIASIIFILTFVSLLSYWHGVRLTVDNPHEELVGEALRISNMLLSPGYPADQPCANMNEIGFALSLKDKRLNSSKIACFETLVSNTPNVLKTKFGTIKEVALEITTYDGNSDKIGVLPYEASISGNVSSAAKISRVVSIYDDNSGKETPATIDLFIYQLNTQ